MDCKIGENCQIRPYVKVFGRCIGPGRLLKIVERAVG
jgi:hypothetical protein